MSALRNFLGSFISLTSPATPDTEFTVAHEMTMIPTGAFVALAGSTASLYRSSTAWDATNAYLKCNQGSCPFLVIFFV